jgi:hypothetical protein
MAEGVQLDWHVMWCARHLEPFRAEWPKGAPVAMLELTRRALEMPAIIDAAEADATNIGKALKRFAPICCFVSHDDLRAVYELAGIAPPASG